MAEVKKSQVYDLPTRLFHFLFAGLFVAAFAIANLTDDESPRFSLHMLFGLTLFVTTLLRVIWGFVGSRYARFTSFPLHPRRLVEYFREVLSSAPSRNFAHNPASAWAAVLMMSLAIGLGTTGYLMGNGGGESLKDLHELMANAFALVAVAHVAGVVMHSRRHRDGIAFSMLHGQKTHVEGARPITSSHRWVATGMLLVIGLFAGSIFTNYNAEAGTTSVWGLPIQLGESEAAESPSDTDEHSHSRGHEGSTHSFEQRDKSEAKTETGEHEQADE